MITSLNEIIDASKVEVKLCTSNVIDLAELEKKLEEETLNLKEKLLEVEIVKTLGVIDEYIVGKTSRGEEPKYCFGSRPNFLDLHVPYYGYNIRPIDKPKTELEILLVEMCYKVGIPLVRKLVIECEEEELYNELETCITKRVDNRFNSSFIRSIKHLRASIPEEMIHEVIYNDKKLGQLQKTRIVFGRDTEAALKTLKQSYESIQTLKQSYKFIRPLI